jgi:hypothetical protein
MAKLRHIAMVVEEIEKTAQLSERDEIHGMETPAKGDRDAVL